MLTVFSFFTLVLCIFFYLVTQTAFPLHLSLAYSLLVDDHSKFAIPSKQLIDWLD